MNLFSIISKPNKDITAKYLEELITDYMSGADKDKTFKSIMNTLNTLTGDNCVDIYVGKETKDFYGMSVYLSDSCIRDIARNIADNNVDTKEMTKYLTGNTISYVIEIDPKIFSPIYKFTPGEVTAILLHELGHVTADSDFYNDLKVSVRKAVFTTGNNDILTNNIKNGSLDLCIIYILSAIQQTHISKHGSDVINEQIADKFVVELGYGNELTSIIEKFSAIYKSRYVRKDIEDITDLEAKTYLHLVQTFKQRRRYVTDLIDTEAKMNASKYIAVTLEDIKKKLAKIIISESVITSTSKKLLDESFLDIFSRDPIKVSQNDIDQLKIELEMVEDYDDKSVIVYKIHKRLTQLTTAKNDLDTNSRDYKFNNNLIDSYIKQLQTILDNAMKFKTVPKTYGVFVKYPKGYEG